MVVCTSPSCNDDEAAMGNGDGVASHHPDCHVVYVGAWDRSWLLLPFFGLSTIYLAPSLGVGRTPECQIAQVILFKFPTLESNTTGKKEKERTRVLSRHSKEEQCASLLNQDEPWRQRQQQQEAAEVEGSTKAKERLLSVRE
jgi:hypothetical protein